MKPQIHMAHDQVRAIRPGATALPVVVLSESESITVVTSDGRPLLEITCSPKGPCIRLAEDNLQLHCPGTLDLVAKSITMRAAEDVVVRGQTIRLN